jgi:hypothetical protein
MGRERVEGKIQSGVKPPQSKKQGSDLKRDGATYGQRMPVSNAFRLSVCGEPMKEKEIERAIRRSPMPFG